MNVFNGIYELILSFVFYIESILEEYMIYFLSIKRLFVFIKCGCIVYVIFLSLVFLFVKRINSIYKCNLNFDNNFMSFILC